jgi:hypothetical protein
MPTTYEVGASEPTIQGTERAHWGGGAQGRMADKCEPAALAARMAAGRTFVGVVAARARGEGGKERDEIVTNLRDLKFQPILTSPYIGFHVC